MATIKDVLNFFNDAIFHDYKNIGIIQELNQIRKCIINSFYKTIPDSRIRVSVSIIDDIFIKTNNNAVENFHDLGEKILYMLAFEKLVRDEQPTIRPFLNDDDDQEYL